MDSFKGYQDADFKKEVLSDKKTKQMIEDREVEKRKWSKNVFWRR